MQGMFPATSDETNLSFPRSTFLVKLFYFLHAHLEPSFFTIDDLMVDPVTLNVRKNAMIKKQLELALSLQVIMKAIKTIGDPHAVAELSRC